MNTAANILAQASSQLATQVADASPLVVAIRDPSHRHVSGLLWRSDVVITSEQAVGTREEYEVVTTAGATTKARIAGRDPGTNLLLLRPERAPAANEPIRSEAHAGALVLALGADVDGATTARLGVVNAVGPHWYSRAGGRIDQRIVLDIRLSRTEEGGPVIDADGALLGMSTFGPQGQVLVIPCATIERIVPQLLRDGHVTRGWLGLGLQPVAIPEALRDAVGTETGMMVMAVAEGSPGGNAGVTVGDILLTVDGMQARRIRQLASLLDAESIGKKVELRLIRGGQILTVEALISARHKS